MKIKYSLVSTVLTIALVLSAYGQGHYTHVDKTKTDMKKHDMSGMMGKPTVDATVEGLHMKVWLMTQKQYKKMMKGNMGQMMMDKDMKEMKHDGMGVKDTHMGMGKDMMGMKHDGLGMNNATREAMMAGTHHIMLDVKDASLGKEIDNASAKVLIVSPSKKNFSVDLQPMMGVLGEPLTLDEKGKNKIAVSDNVDGVSKTKQFQYSVK